MSKTHLTLNFIAVFINIFILAVGQVPPGVNPSHYQQQQYQPVEQQFQQPQYQQQAFQQQPPPPGQQPPPPPVQQQYPPHQQPQPQLQQQQQQQQQGHGHHHGEPQLLNTANIGQEREHIQEHMDLPIDTSKMSEKELHYHYFTMHDADKNNKLDGCELIKSLIHWHDENKGVEVMAKTDSELEKIVDLGLQRFDIDNDGYITYTEYCLKAGKP